MAFLGEKACLWAGHPRGCAVPLQQRRVRCLAPGRGFSTTAHALFGGSASSSLWVVPTRLVSANEEGDTSPAPLTVYTVRLTTSLDRGAALSEPMAGVNVCLVGKDGRAVLQRISPVNDPEAAHAHMQEICTVAGADAGVGADCAILETPAGADAQRDTPAASPADAPAPQQPAWLRSKAPRPKPRFQEGAVDEVSFLAPELGPLQSVMVAPEGGSWVLDEMDVCSSRTGHMDRFVCRSRLGGRSGEHAAYLSPVPVDSVVYGSGDSAVILTKEQASQLRRRGMAGYAEMKQRLLTTTALLAAGGSGVAGAAGGLDAALPFALGGLAGLLYQFLLQVGAEAALPQGALASARAGLASASAAVPSAPASSAPQGVPLHPAPGGAQELEPATQAAQVRVETGGGPAPEPMPASTLAGGGRGLQRVLGNPMVRLGGLAATALAAVWAVQASGVNLGRDSATEPAVAILLQPPTADAWQLGVAFLGFMMYKVALLGVSMSPLPGIVQPVTAEVDQRA